MREIKFQGKSKKTEKWIYGDLIQWKSKGRCSITPQEGDQWKSPSDFEVYPDSVGQFSGLLDKDGTEIYEGDIVETFIGNICEIKWDRVEESTSHFDFNYTGFCFRHIEQKLNYHLDSTEESKVIGNIYNNPELLTTTP